MSDDPTLGADQLHDFVAQARWFGGKGRPFAVSGVRRLGTLGEGRPTLSMELVTLTYDDAEGGQDLYQVPLAHYPEPQAHLEHARIGSWSDLDLGTTHVYDAVHDRAAMGLLYAAFDHPPEGDLHFERLPGHELDLTTHSTLFSGEQSNSSVAFGEDALLKLFRRITPGRNPDISVHEVLTRAGSDHVAALYGWLEVSTSSTDVEPGSPTEVEPVATSTDVEPGSPTDVEPVATSTDVLQLAMLQQFLRTASDGWELALASVRNLFAEGDLHADEVGGDFAGEAARLGVALRETHETLAEHFPRSTRDTAEQAELVAAMHDRLEDAVRIVPELAQHTRRLREVFDRVAGLSGVTIQQIHADLHLGQTLRTVKGWKIVDFEGEPAKPLEERVLPDSPWRDVAGMLRSFDYAPRVVERTYGDSEPMGADQRAFRSKEWSKRNRSVFVEAYAGRRLTADEEALLAAYVADKAVYEAVYEARNRPTWVTIPLDAIAEVVAT